ncbi:MAG: hypothetical protein KGZ68_16995 [Dechloromonas sp.]|nr:hypothetical protein [Dechloromonas sp.]
MDAKTHGLAEAQRSADSNGPGWTETALNALDHYAQMAATPFTIEEAREWIGDLVPPPKDERAWGAVAAMAVRHNHIKAVGYAPALSSHGSPKRTYVWVK